MTEQTRDAQLRQMASGIINTADPIWRAEDRPTVWDRIRELRDHAETRTVHLTLG